MKNPRVLKITREERFWLKVRKTNKCWIWVGSVSSGGYGQFRYDSRTMITAHRFSYIVHNGEFDRKLLVCHTCDTPKCVNPKHLFLGTSQDNVTDMMNKGRHSPGVQPKGVDNPKSKMTKELVLEFRKMHKSGVSFEKLSKIYGISHESIRRAVRGIGGYSEI